MFYLKISHYSLVIFNTGKILLDKYFHTDEESEATVEKSVSSSGRFMLKFQQFECVSSVFPDIIFKDRFIVNVYILTKSKQIVGSFLKT